MSGLRVWTIDATDNIFQLMVINVLWLGIALLNVTIPPALAGLFIQPINLPTVGIPDGKHSLSVFVLFSGSAGAGSC